MRAQRASLPPKIRVQPLDTTVSFRNMAYGRLKKAITEMDIYDHPDEIRLDERQLSQDLAVSRTPVREAITLLEQEGFVRSVPRRGIFVVKKTKKRDPRDDHGLGGAGEHVGASRRPACDGPGAEKAQDAVLGVREREADASTSANIRTPTSPSIRRSSGSAAAS